MGLSSVLVVVVGLVVVVLAALAVLASMFRKVGPNQALIVYGLGGTKVVKGGGPSSGRWSSQLANCHSS